MVAIEYRMDESLVDRPAVPGGELRELFASLLERRRTFAGPDHGVERKPCDHFGMPFGKHRGAQRARRYSINKERPFSAQLLDVEGSRITVVRALRDWCIVVAILGRAPIAFHVDAPAVVAAAREVIHCR